MRCCSRKESSLAQWEIRRRIQARRREALRERGQARKTRRSMMMLMHKPKTCSLFSRVFCFRDSDFRTLAWLLSVTMGISVVSFMLCLLVILEVNVKLLVMGQWLVRKHFLLNTMVVNAQLSILSQLFCSEAVICCSVSVSLNLVSS